MNTKKILAIVLIVSFCISSVGCGFFADKRNDDNRLHRSESSVRDEIINALDNQDEAALKSLFSNETIAQVSDLDKKIKEYIGFFKGNFVSYDSKSGSESGMLGDSFNHWYIITTDEDEYVIYFDYIARDVSFEKENNNIISDAIGLHTIVILRKELADEIVHNPWPHAEGAFVLYTMEDSLSNDY